MSKKILQIAKGELDDNAIWFMRQAGRYLPDYKSLREGKTFTDLLRDPRTISKITSLPLKYLDVDALVVFTDILLPFTKLDYQVSYENGISITSGRRSDFDYYSSLSKGMINVSEEHSDKTIIGVVGGPFTTLSYLYDRGRNGYHKTKAILSSRDESILGDMTDQIIEFARLQANSGADVIQVFDSWLGGVSETFYDKYLKKNESYFVEKIKDLGKPVIFFSEGASHLYSRLLDLRPDVFSIDWRMDLTKFKSLCSECIVQGNLDPNLLGNSDQFLKDETVRIMRGGKRFRGHIFNLGHGVQPWTDWRKLALVANEVQNYDR